MATGDIHVKEKCWCGGWIVYRPDQPGVAICLDSRFHDPFASGKREWEDISKLYVAGPMTGYPHSNYPVFNSVSRLLREAGFEVVNPAEFGNGKHYIDFLREDLRLMLDCHGVAVLENWWESTGARNEVQVAGVLKMPVLPWVDWIDRYGKTDQVVHSHSRPHTA